MQTQSEGKLTKPRNGQQTNGEEEVEKEKHHDGHNTRGLSAIGNRSSEHRHTNTLSRSSKEHELSSPESIDNPNRN